MKADNRTNYIVGVLVDKFNKIFSAHTDEHNRIVEHIVDTIVTEGDFQVRLDCFNTVTPYQTTIFEALFLANGYRIVTKSICSWTATFDFVYVGTTGKLGSVLDYFKIREYELKEAAV